MATLTAEVPDELAEEFTRLVASVDHDVLVTTLLADLIDRVHRLPAARQAIADNPDLPIGFVLDLLEARAEGHQSAAPFSPGVRPPFTEQA